jgi:hypothetical protein
MLRKPTKAEIEAEPPGWRMDQWVAHFVFGWQVFTYVTLGMVEEREPYSLVPPGHPLNVSHTRLAPMYSIHDGQSMEVLHLLAGKYTNVSLHGANGWGLTCFDIPYGLPAKKGDPLEQNVIGPFNGDTIAHAVCKTGLIDALYGKVGKAP